MTCRQTAILILMALIGLPGLCQQAPQEAPYLRFPVIPPFRLLQTDSATVFTRADLEKKKRVLVFVFSPDCEHCQEETKELVQRIDEFKNIQVLMTTTMPFHSMQSFAQTYRLSQYKQITIGRDLDAIFPSFFQLRNFPYFALYDKKGNLITTFEGSVPLDKIIKSFQ